MSCRQDNVKARTARREHVVHESNGDAGTAMRSAVLFQKCPHAQAMAVLDPCARPGQGDGGDASGKHVQVGAAKPEPVEPEPEVHMEDMGAQNEEYDYEHFWDLAASEDAPSEDELEAALDVARKEYAEQVRCLRFQDLENLGNPPPPPPPPPRLQGGLAGRARGAHGL